MRKKIICTNFQNSKIKKRPNKELLIIGDKAKIIQYSTVGKDGFKSNVICAFQPFKVTFIVLAKVLIEKPIYALIRDTKGQQIYGQNTHFSKIPTVDLKVVKK